MAVLKSSLILSLIDNVSGRAGRINKALDGITRQSSSLVGLTSRLAAFGGAYIGVTKGFSSTIGAAVEFESAFADVKKVVEATPAQFEVMSKSIRKMSTELPMASTEIAALFAAAGESGIATNELQSFAEMAARVGIAFDMTAADAGESLAKLKTQFGLTVAETGDLADAVNHLSNNMASKSSEITTFLLKVGSLSEMAGFAKEEVAALGSAMIAAGAQPEVAATAMQNVAKKMTAGALAKKEQKDVAKMLGLDLPTLAKEMQKDAPGAVKKVLKAIGKQSKDKHISLLSGFFGDEAKAFAPLIANTELLDKALDAVADRRSYVGSAFREFAARADTTANAFTILRNKIGYFFEDWGMSWLPSLKTGIAEFGHVLDTLDSRFTIFDEIKARLGGLASGLGLGDGTDVFKSIRDLIFGAEDASAAADKYGRLFGQFQDYGRAIRQFGEDIAKNPIVKFFKDLSPYYFEVLKWSLGFILVAGAIRKLASAMMLLSGASTIIAAVKGIGSVAAALGIGGGAAVAGSRGAGASVAGAAAKKGGQWLARWLGGTGAADWVGAGRRSSGLTAFEKIGQLTGRFGSKLGWLGRGASRLLGTPSMVAETTFRALDAVPHGTMESATRGNPDLLPALDRANAMWRGVAFEGGMHRAGLGAGPQPVTIDASSIAAMTQPSGVQQVQVMNHERPHITVNAPVTITGISSPQDAVEAAASRLGQAAKSALESSFSGGGGF